MRVRILFFGMLRDLAGKSADLLDVRDDSTVGDVLVFYQNHMPRLAVPMATIAIAVNQQYAGPGTKLHENDEIALLPPVSGGSIGSQQDTSPTSQPRTQIVHERIDRGRIVDSLKTGDDGAVVIFEGTVRNQTRGRKTLYLDYEAYEPMALQQMESLAARALQEFQIRDVALVHRLGRLEIGETSVLIVVVAAHRAAAFDACRWLIDTLKRVVPIWKKEHFADGAVWADGEPFPPEIARANPPRNHP